MEDPPSISEGCGGRVTDYRINVSPLFFQSLAVCILNEPSRELKTSVQPLCFNCVRVYPC